MPDSSPASPGTRALSTLKAFLAVTACVVAVIFANHCFARQNLRAFDPQEVGRGESSMWRSYYEERWVSFGWQAMRLARASER
jgi:hypothetical protein